MQLMSLGGTFIYFLYVFFLQESGIAFVPMIYGNCCGLDQLPEGLPDNITTILGFNEPNHMCAAAHLKHKQTCSPCVTHAMQSNSPWLAWKAKAMRAALSVCMHFKEVHTCGFGAQFDGHLDC